MVHLCARFVGYITMAYLDKLSPTQEHFLKKFLVEECVRQELHELLQPGGLALLGPPFSGNSKSQELSPGQASPRRGLIRLAHLLRLTKLTRLFQLAKLFKLAKLEKGRRLVLAQSVLDGQSLAASTTAANGPGLPLLRYFFSTFVATFPFVTMNLPQDQHAFWTQAVQPFVESFASKQVAPSQQPRDRVTKRRQVNERLLKALALFFNSMLSLPQELAYLNSAHLKPLDQGKLHKIAKAPVNVKAGLGLFQATEDYSHMRFFSDLSVNIVAVDVVAQVPRQSWNPLRLLERKHNWHCHFVLHVTRRTPLHADFAVGLASDTATATSNTSLTKPQDPALAPLDSPSTVTPAAYEYHSHYLCKTYADFQRLRRDLARKYPGVMATSVPQVPLKPKNDNGIVGSDTVESLPVTSGLLTPDVGALPLDHDTAHRLYGDKHRLALRGWLHTVLSKPELATSEPLAAFLDSPSQNFDELLPKLLQDQVERLQQEKARFATQEQFQDEVAKTMYELAGNFEEFKQKLLDDPHSLGKVFEDLGRSKSAADCNPLLRLFVEWCKLEVAATLYQIFMTQDNSSEILQKCRKFHRLFPYRVCYGILKYTNPVKIMSRMIDLLLMDMPLRSKNQPSNLLAMIFIMLLNEDLQDFSAERQSQMAQPPLNRPEYKVFLDRIVLFVHGDGDANGLVREEADRSGQELLLVVLSSDEIEPSLDASARQIFDDEIVPSHKAYKLLSAEKAQDKVGTYLALRQMWQLEIRTRDKEAFKQLWREPELTRLLKKSLTIFYQPLMMVMKECDVHLVFLDWQKFVGELLDALNELDRGEVYFTSSVEILGIFKRLLDKYEGTLWQFMRNLYLKDEGMLFKRLIAWIEKFLVVLRTKFSDPSKVELDLRQMQVAEPIDESKFRQELDSRVSVILRKRLMLKQMMQRAANSEPVSQQEKINKRWDELNGLFDISATEMGVGVEDYTDMSVMLGPGGDHLDKDAGPRELSEIADMDFQLEEVYEMAKLVAPAHELMRTRIGSM